MNEFDLRFSQKYLSDKNDFEHFVLSLKEKAYLAEIKKYFHFNEQRKFVCNEYDQIIVDYIARYEDFDNDLNKLCSMIGVEYVEVRENVTKGREESLDNIYTSTMRDIVYDIYIKDFQIFDYPKDIG